MDRPSGIRSVGGEGDRVKKDQPETEPAGLNVYPETSSSSPAAPGGAPVTAGALAWNLREKLLRVVQAAPYQVRGFRAHSHLPPAVEGIPQGAVTEVSGPSGGGKTEWMLRFLARHPELSCIWIEQGERHSLYPAALHQRGVDPGRVLCVEVAETGSQRVLWAALQALSSRLAPVVVVGLAEGTSLEPVDLRRLQIEAERSGATAVVMAENPTEGPSWPLALQLRIQGWQDAASFNGTGTRSAAEPAGFQCQLLKGKGRVSWNGIV
ncbi:MAG TPA: hypothetical protein VL588_10685 [Bdellovibrionota bacterium]|nr:hypothetical protein [Bdellovibrionota bacterium]